MIKFILFCIYLRENYIIFRMIDLSKIFIYFIYFRANQTDPINYLRLNSADLCDIYSNPKTNTMKYEAWTEPNRTENLIDSQLERESFPEEFHPNNMEFVYDTRPCYRLGWAAGHPLSKAPFGYGGPKIRSLLSTEIAPCPLGGRPFSCFVEWPPI